MQILEFCLIKIGSVEFQFVKLMCWAISHFTMGYLLKKLERQLIFIEKNSLKKDKKYEHN